MKKLILFSFACLVAGFSNAQQVNAADVPSSVKSSFHEKFLKAKEITWSRVNPKEFEAEFESDGKKASAKFSLAGVWTSTETKIKSADLPKAVRTTIAKDFAGYKLTESEKDEAPGKPFAYETTLAKGKITYEVKFSSDGKVIKKEEKKAGKTP